MKIGLIKSAPGNICLKTCSVEFSQSTVPHCCFHVELLSGVLKISSGV